MKKLLVYLKDYKKETVLAPLFKLLEATFELIIPLLVAAMIDVGIPGNDMPYILRMCLLMVMLGIVGLVCSITAQYFAAKAAAGFGSKLRHSLFAHIQQLSYTELDELGTSTLITRMTSDINQVQSGVNLVLRLFLRSPCIVFGAMIMAFTIDFQAALIFAVAILLLGVVVFGIMLLSIPLYKKVQGLLDKVLKTTRENLSGVRVIRAFHREEQEQELFEEGNLALTKMQNYVGRITAFMNPVTYVIINVALIWLLYTGAIQVDGGIITQGAVVALVNYMSQILVELVKLANLIIIVTKAVACGNRVENVLRVENSQCKRKEQVSFAKEQDAVITFQDVSFQYKNAGAYALDQISFSAKRGETIGVIGGTGAGKTTLVNLIPAFYETTKGNILFHGVDVKKILLKELRSKIGMVPQQAVLFEGTIEENLKWGKEDASTEELKQALLIAQASEVVAGKEKGLDSLVSQGGKNFSGGQRQRLTIARALVRKPEILILDDSASALDYATDAKLRKAIREMEDSPVVFVVSQRTASVRYADQIMVLEEGKMVGLGSHQQLIDTCQVYREIYESQYSADDADKK